MSLLPRRPLSVLLPVRRAHVLPEAPVVPLERRSGVLWVTVGSRLGDTAWYPPQPAQFELVEANMAANAAPVNFGPSLWDHDVALRFVAVGPAADDFRIMCRLDNRTLVLPPEAFMLFAPHALTISFEPPFSIPVSES